MGDPYYYSVTSLTSSCHNYDYHFSIESFRWNHEQTSSKLHGIHLSSARRSFGLLNRIRQQEVISKVCSGRH